MEGEMRRPTLEHVWRGATVLVGGSRRFGWVDLLLVLGLVGLLFGLVDLGREWTGPYRPSVQIELSLSALPAYALFSLSRGLIAYAISLSFTLLYGYWAAKDHRAERVLLPLLDILQSIPVLGFMPGLILALVALFPRSNVGLELAAIIMIFTGQAWNMTFSFYHALRSVPGDLQEVARVYRFDWWRRLKWVELPHATIGLVWNSMMSMAGGWFFLMINEAFQLGDRDFRLPGIGSYMSVAVERGRIDAMLYAIAAMIGMIVLLDQLLWRPVVVWAQKFRVEEWGQGADARSWFLDWLRRSRMLGLLGRVFRGSRTRSDRNVGAERPVLRSQPSGRSGMAALLPLVPLALLLGMLAFAGLRLVGFLRGVSVGQWQELVGASLWTLARVLLATALGTLWALPAGLAIGLSPRLSRTFQPIVQIAASFPAPMLFPLVIAGLKLAGVSLGWGSIVLMLLGTQWYILFNVIAGATAIPADLREAAESYRIRGRRRFWGLYLPAVFPYLVTGWVTAAGGAWNASIVAEFVTFKGETLRTTGLGAEISAAAEAADFPVLAASVLVMSLLVVTFNRSVWRRCYALAERRYSLNK
jgi:NitT/TauT family transport system permease protein